MSSGRQEAARSEISSRPPLSFSAGQTVTGRVVASNPNGQLLLEIDGRTVSARTSLSLPIGKEFQFIVSRADDIPWLALKEEGPVQQLFRFLATDTAAQLASHAAESKDVGEFLNLPGAPAALATLHGLLGLLAVSEKSPLDSILLTALLLNPAADKRSPLFKLPDEQSLTAVLEELSRKGEGFSAKQRQSLENLVQLGRLLSLGAEGNGQILRQHNANLLIFPLFFTGNGGWGEWMLRFEDRPKSGAKPQEGRVLVDFLLNMSHLGQLQLSLFLDGKTVQGTFLLADKQAASHVEKHLEELKSSLGAIGYAVPSLRCGIMRKNNQATLKDLLGEHLQIPNLSLVDLSV